MQRLCPYCRLKTTEKICPEDGYQTVDASAYSSQEEAVDEVIGSVFQDRYKIESLLGRGGFGSVYKANQLAVNRPVAIKIMNDGMATELKEVARFQQEAKAIANMQHPNIISLIDFGQAASRQLYLVMEFLEGQPLQEAMKATGAMPPDRVIGIGMQILDGLAEAHNAGIIHRDLKPENLFLVADRRGRDRIKILDFGIAKVDSGDAPQMTLTGTGIAIGSPRYMSPEQARGLKVTARTDLYSLGVILYELLTAQRIFDCQTATDYLMAHVRDRPKPPVVDGQVVSGPLIDFIMRCLSKDASHRPAGAVAAQEQLEACLGQPLVAGGAALAAGGTLETMARGAAGPAGISGRSGVAPQATGRADAWGTGSQSASGVPFHGTGQQPAVSNTAVVAIVALLATLLLAVGGGAAWYFIAGPGSASVSPQPTPSEAAEASADDESEDPESGDPKAAQPAGGDQAPKAEPGDEPPAESDEAEPAAEEPPAEEPPAEEPPAEPQQFAVNVDSEPTGAKVRRAGTLIGETPLEVTWERGEDPPVLEIRRYVSATRSWEGQLTLSPDQHDETHKVKLTLKRRARGPSKPATVEAAKPATSKPATSKPATSTPEPSKPTEYKVID